MQQLKPVDVVTAGGGFVGLTLAKEITARTSLKVSKATRGVTAARYAEGTNVVLIDPDVLEIFPNARAVNEALRTFARLTKPRGRSQGRKRRTA